MDNIDKQQLFNTSAIIERLEQLLFNISMQVNLSNVIRIYLNEYYCIDFKYIIIPYNFVF